MNRLVPVVDTRYRVLATLLAVALLLSGALNCFLLIRADNLTDLAGLTSDDDAAERLAAVRTELAFTQALLARCQAANPHPDSARVAARPPGR